MFDLTSAICRESSSICVEDNLLFVISNITNHTYPQIMGYFLDRAVEASGCPSNVFRKMWSVDKQKTIRAAISSDTHHVVVFRGYYPSTPIAFKMSVFVSLSSAATTQDHKRVVQANVKMIAETKHSTKFSFKELTDIVTRSSLFNDWSNFPKIRRPKALTPTGATPQHFRPSKRVKRRGWASD